MEANMSGAQPTEKPKASDIDVCNGCINCDGTHTLILSSLLKAYQNGLTDVVAKAEGVIPNNDHHLTVLRHMTDDIMKHLAQLQHPTPEESNGTPEA